ncbi:expressed unknown protein [Seminavis robusta]|uniref:Uncharacterized protein n=1 Tax=Seminavis robusta TaxID=568900 RepID=A0A9N8EP26_9STRA|nr:expressed unknown protein [Seminavis robusta]|eukprot:Sro1507_g278390.1 n/a (158) ;mRNA; r:20283-20756
MIKSLLAARSMNKSNSDNEAPKFVFPYGHGTSIDEHAASFDDQRVNKNTSPTNHTSKNKTRKCFTCGEQKAVTQFPMSVRKSRVCRFCVSLDTRGLDLMGMSCEGNASLKCTFLEETSPHNSHRRGSSAESAKFVLSETASEGSGEYAHSSGDFVFV